MKLRVFIKVGVSFIVVIALVVWLLMLWLSPVPPVPPRGPLTFGPVSGAVTTDSAVVVAGLRERDATARLLVSTNKNLQNPIRSEPVEAKEASGRAVKLKIARLRPDTRYYYAIEVNGAIALESTGRFRTFPEGRPSFSFAFRATLLLSILSFLSIATVWRWMSSALS